MGLLQGGMRLPLRTAASRSGRIAQNRRSRIALRGTMKWQHRGMLVFLLSWVLLLTTCCARGACSGNYEVWRLTVSTSALAIFMVYLTRTHAA